MMETIPAWNSFRAEKTHQSLKHRILQQFFSTAAKRILREFKILGDNLYKEVRISSITKDGETSTFSGKCKRNSTPKQDGKLVKKFIYNKR